MGSKSSDFRDQLSCDVVDLRHGNAALGSENQGLPADEIVPRKCGVFDPS